MKIHDSWSFPAMLEMLTKTNYQCICHCGLRSDLHPNDTVSWWMEEHAKETGHLPVLVKFMTVPVSAKEVIIR